VATTTWCCGGYVAGDTYVKSNKIEWKKMPGVRYSQKVVGSLEDADKRE